MMKIRRVIPPAAAPIPAKCLLWGLFGLFRGKWLLEKREEELRQHFGIKHVFLFSSGKAALTIILRALKSLAPEKDEVLIPAYTCFSVPSGIVKAGLRVSLCDIDLTRFDFDYRLLEEAVSERTLCVVPDHLFGIPADMDRITALCRAKGVFVVEDAAQAMGGVYRGKRLGTLGDVGFFSLGRGKNLICGSGGIVVTNSDLIARKIAEEYECLEGPSQIETLKELLNVVLLALFIRPSLYWFPAGLPFLRLGETIFYRDFPIKRLSGVQAGLLENWQIRLSESNGARRRSARWFIDALRLADRYDDIPYLRLPIMALNHESREKILSLSRCRGLGVSTMYPTPIHEIEEFREQFRGASFPVAREVSQRILTIPTHQLLTQSDRERIAALNLHPDRLASHSGREPALLADRIEAEREAAETGRAGNPGRHEQQRRLLG
jgi:dTDP-4-amino-4,6-dideoxygalactose transaminase